MAPIGRESRAPVLHNKADSRRVRKDFGGESKRAPAGAGALCWGDGGAAMWAPGLRQRLLFPLLFPLGHERNLIGAEVVPVVRDRQHHPLPD